MKSPHILSTISRVAPSFQCRLDLSGRIAIISGLFQPVKDCLPSKRARCLAPQPFVDCRVCHLAYHGYIRDVKREPVHMAFEAFSETLPLCKRREGCAQKRDSSARLTSLLVAAGVYLPAHTPDASLRSGSSPRPTQDHQERVRLAVPGVTQ